MQRWHEEEQRSFLQLQEAAKACHAERASQKARREAEAKAKEEAERLRVVEEEERKRRIIEYLQRLWDEVLEEKTALLERAEGSQVVGSKCKEVAAGDEKGQQSSKKARGKQPGKYCGGAAVKMGGSNPCERCVCARQNCLVHPSRWVINNYTYLLFFNNFLLYSCSFACARCIILKQQCVSHTPTTTPAMIPTYGGVLSAIEKALQELVEEY